MSHRKPKPFSEKRNLWPNSTAQRQEMFSILQGIHIFQMALQMLRGDDAKLKIKTVPGPRGFGSKSLQLERLPWLPIRFVRIWSLSVNSFPQVFVTLAYSLESFSYIFRAPFAAH
jgi:hypothetical protein